MSFNSICVDTIVPRHGTAVSIPSLQISASAFSGVSIGSSTFTNGSITNSDLDLKSSLMQYAVTGLFDASTGSTAITDCYCNVWTSVMYPFVMFGISGLVEADGSTYTTLTYVPSGTPRIELTGASTLPSVYRPDKNANFEIVAVDNNVGSHVVLTIATTGLIDVGPFTGETRVFVYPYAGVYQLSTVTPI